MTGLDAQVSAVRGQFALDATLSGRAGEVVALLGPNAAGKTTLLRCLAGLHPLRSGRVLLGDEVLDDTARGVRLAAERRRIGYVFQDYLLFPHLDVRDNVAFGPRSAGAGRAASRAAADGWLHRLDLAGIADRHPRELSGGQAQRVALARALASDPRLLLLDEPLAALDAGTRGTVRTRLRQHLDGFTGVSLLVTHDPLDAMVLADRIVVLEHGRVVQDARPAEVARRPASPYVARLVGLNLVRGVASGTQIALEGGGVLRSAEHAVRGPALAAFRPEAISVHLGHPEGSPRNVWTATVAGLESQGDRVRVDLDGEPSAFCVVTPAAVADLALRPGDRVWLSMKATDVEVYPWE